MVYELRIVQGVEILKLEVNALCERGWIGYPDYPTLRQIRQNGSQNLFGMAVRKII